jgi:hypothetical protein
VYKLLLGLAALVDQAEGGEALCQPQEGPAQGV